MGGGGGGGGQGGGHVPPKIREKYFSGNYYVNSGIIGQKNDIKFQNFVNFSGKYNKNSRILLIFGQESCKIRSFC